MVGMGTYNIGYSIDRPLFISHIPALQIRELVLTLREKPEYYHTHSLVDFSAYRSQWSRRYGHMA